MTTIILNNEYNLNKTTFENIQDLFSFAIENNLITEIWQISENNLNEKSRNLLLNSKNNKTKKLIDL